VTSITSACYTNTIPIGALRDDEGVSNGAAGQDTLCILGAPTITTTPNPGSAVVGTRLQDTAGLSGGTSPTGSVTFKLYAQTDPTCSGTPIFTETRAVTPSFTSATTTGFIANTAGTWHWLASYGGDANNSPSSSLCTDEAVTVSKASPSITTVANPVTGTVGINIAAAGDSVTSMSGAFNPTGSITFTLYSDATCNTAVGGMTGNGTILGGVASWSKSWTPVTPGTYYWQASYAGDSNNNSILSACGGANEQIIIAKSTPLLTTTALGPVTLGNSIHDTAHLTGGYGSLGGTISFEVFAPDDPTCLSPIAVTPNRSVNGTGDYTSADFVTTMLGDYHWIAHYSGDASNASVSTTCNETGETSTVGKATPVLTTAASGPVSVGGDITDTAHLTGVYGLLDGTITFSVFAPGDTTCSTALNPQPASAAVIGSGNYTSGAFTTAEVGDYRWQAFYSGDANNNPVSTTCNEAGEISIVNTLANPTLTTTASGPVAVGATITDTAHLSGGSGTLGGTLSFNLYMPGDDTCSNVPVMLAADRAFDGVGDYTSVAYTATEAGTYRWRALYSGDDNNNAINTGCYDVGETSVVDQATPVLTTTASGPVTVGATIRDTAHMSGGYGTLGGTLAFNIYAPGDTTCSSPSAVTPNVTVSGAADYISANFTSLTAGTYRWRAFYSGDVNNSAVSTACNDPSESSLANKATPTLTTTATVSTIVGATITDVAHLGAGYGTLGGTVSFDTFAPGDTTCSSPIVVGSVVPVSGTGNYTSSPYTTTAVGSYRWIAHYSGDTDNIAVSTACNDAGETSAVNKATPILTTTAAGPVTVGQSITDTAHLSGGYGTLGGSLSFSIYAPGDATCSTPTLVTPDVPVSGTGNYASASFTTLATGSYRWRAFYSGDLNNNLVNTPCNDAGETSTVTQAPPTLTTTATASVTVGGTITDTAHLSGGFGTLGGTVSFKVYAPGDIFCFTPIDVSPAVSVNGSNDYTSANFTTLAVGAYRWRAFYSGDTNNIAVSTACNDVGESTTVIKASPTISTTASPSTGTVGTAITAGDSATLSSAFSPTGQVTFTLHSDPSCTILVVGMSGSGSLAGTSANWSNGWTPVAAGTYFWTAAYPGDANNNSFTTSCGDANEQIVIGKATPTVTTIIHDINDAPVSSIPLGSTVHDSSTVSGVTGITPTGNVIFNFFNNETCTAPSAASSTPFDLVAGSVDASGFTQNPASTGRYSFQANYSGDDKYLAENSACEPLVVVAPPVITKTFFTNMILVNDSVALTFHISNPNDASGGGMTLTGVNFTDSLPAGLVVSTPNGVTGSCGGGTITASSGSTVVSLGGASLIAGGSCTFSVDVTGTTAGLKNNSVTVNSTEGGTGNTSSDSVMVIAPALSIIKSVSSTTKVSAGTWEVTYSLLVENTGNADLTALQVTDDLSATFPLPTTMTFQSVTSPDFTVSPSYNGSSDINLLAGVDTLVTGAHGTITLIVRVVPTESGPFTNVSTASAQPPLGGRISAQSPAVAVTFGPNLFDPPMGIKTVDASGQPVLHWTMVWINDTNLVSVNAVVHDPIPVNTTYSPTLVDSGYPVPGGAPSGSTSIGVSCTTPGSVTVTTLCYYEGPTVANPRGQIIWSGSLGPDFGITDPALATNAIHIGFNVRATTGTTSVQNEATIDSDLNGNGTTTDAGEQQVARASALWNSIPSVLPSTGFPMGEVTALPLPSISYPSLGDLWLEIPNLGLKMPIVGVPQSADGTWDVTWLGNSAGWLNGTAFPTWTGNSVLTGHVWNADNTPGPFSTINKLWYGNQVIIHVSGGKYVYEVREVLQVEPDSVSSMLKHEDRSWITLVTCRGFDATNNTYTYRVLVRAVLVSVK
jgi:LPXTG-site transpeptidase (sortase) family protein